jgi:peroxiredoxin family protein
MQAPISAPTEMQEMVRQAVDEYLAEKARQEEARVKKIALISTKGTLDMAYPPLILATTAAALGWDSAIFFTFYGLNIIHKQKQTKLQVAPLGNPAMPMPVPNLLGAIPGMTSLGTSVMRSLFKSHGVASIDDLLEAAVASGVRLMPCAMTMEVFGYKSADFMEGAEAACGAATFLDWASDADISLLI